VLTQKNIFDKESIEENSFFIFIWTKYCL